MVSNNYKEPDKIAFANWVDKVLDVIMSKRNIKNGFKVIKIWPLNPKDMDGRTKPNELSIAKDNIIPIDEKNVKNSDEGLNDIQGWGEHGTTVKFISIGIIEEPATIRCYVDVQEHPPRYYVEELRIHVSLEDIGIEVDMDYIINLGEPIDVFKRQLLHFTKIRTPLCLKNLLSLPHLPIRKTHGKEPLIDYNESHVVTFDEYLQLLHKKNYGQINNINNQRTKEK
jgi:hypothetical protein